MLSRYIARKFWGPFFFVLCIFAILIFLGDSIEKMRWVNLYDTSIRLVLKYSLLSMPSWLGQIFPICCLLSGLFVISDMIANGEWTACLAGGFSVRQIFKPIFACILIVSLGGFLAQEFLIPNLSKKAELTLQRKIRKNKDWQFNVQRDVTLRLDDKRILFAKSVNPEQGLMQGMFIDIYNDNWSIEKQINAKNFRWNKAEGTWFFEDGFIRTFGEGSSISKEESFEELSSDFHIPPEQIAVGKIKPAYLNIKDLFNRIKFLKASGLTYFQELTFINTKIAAPFATIVMCLLGLPFAIALKRSSKLINIILALCIGFGFWWVVSLMTSAGESGMINPYIAGWAPVVIFFIVACVEFKYLKI